jgi:hypothetical protein
MRVPVTLLIGALLLGACETAPPVVSPAEELAELKRICASLLGTQFGSPPLYKELKPHLRDRYALETLTTYCGFNCFGHLELRGGYQFDFQFPNPGPTQRYEGLRRDEEIVWSVTLMHGKKQVFHRELEGVRTSLKGPNHPMQPTASPRTALLLHD